MKCNRGALVPPNQCCTLLNSTFSLSFTTTTAVALPSMPSLDFPLMVDIIIDWEGISNLINNAKVSYSAGVDGINNKLVKSTNVYSSLMLSEIFTQSLQTGMLPDDWKVGKVVPVRKSGTKMCTQERCAHKMFSVL